MTTPLSPNEKPFSISQIKVYIPITLDMNKLNYQAWRELFETHCTCFGVLGHIDGTSSSTPKTAKTWTEHDGLVKMWIYGTISESILDTVLTTKATARDLGLTIESLFRDNKAARALELESELRTIVIGDLTVHAYCQKLKSISDLLANLDSPVTDQALVLHLLNGLSDKFDNIINVIKHKTPFPGFLEARSMLTMEEKRLSKQISPTSITTSSAPALLYTTSDPQQQSLSSTNNNTGGFNTNNGGSHNNNSGGSHNNNSGGYYTNNRGRGRGRSRGRGRGRFGNNWQQSYFSPPWHFGNSPWTQSYFSSPSPLVYPSSPQLMGSNPHYQAQQQRFAQPGLIGPPPTRPPHEAHLAHDQSSFSPYLPANITQAFNTMSLADPYNSPWIMDSGATNHITSHPGGLTWKKIMEVMIRSVRRKEEEDQDIHEDIEGIFDRES
ncbi:PREDICTED: uncharacterized protein LOC104710330 [Camelina sativa]|uniref:Uncharacterized protein LOC104710330 n=1 Tax=Camelina sativa TaxID=90675 RepID=A0ABM0TEK1_CAMSA|nr:PREDICTED: uncharacterized protein LOC104710330 [Camelina sativa]